MVANLCVDRSNLYTIEVNYYKQVCSEVHTKDNRYLGAQYVL